MKKFLCSMIGIVSVVGISVYLISPLLKKVNNKMYKERLKKEEIDFDNLGPEIVKVEEKVE